MGMYTKLILSMGPSEDSSIEWHASRALKHWEALRPIEVDGCVGGPLYAEAKNLDLAAYLAHLASLEWRDHSAVELVTKAEDDRWRVYWMDHGGVWRTDTPTVEYDAYFERLQDY